MSYSKMTGLRKVLLIATFIFVGSSCAMSPESPQVAKIVNTPDQTWTAPPTSLPFPFTAQPTPPGTWAGLRYEDRGWELTYHDGYERRPDYSLYEYVDGQEVLIHPNIGGCELSYWYGGADEFTDEIESLSAVKTLQGRGFGVLYVLNQGELVQIKYVYDSGLEYSPEVWLSAYIGTLNLRFISGKIEPCVAEAERLLATLDPLGLFSQQIIHTDREAKRQSGELYEEP